MWAKYTAFEIAHRAPMMIHVPGRVDQVNYEHSARDEHLNIYHSMFSENGGVCGYPTHFGRGRRIS